MKGGYSYLFENIYDLMFSNVLIFSLMILGKFNNRTDLNGYVFVTG